MLRILDCGYVRVNENKSESCEDKKYNFHIFHDSCLIKWFQKKFECPLCRTHFYNSYIEFLSGEKQEEIAV